MDLCHSLIVQQFIFEVLKPGTGDRKPISGELIKLRIEGKLEDGQKVDSSDSLSFLLGHSEVIPGKHFLPIL